MTIPRLRTARLLMREWREDDRALFAAMNADPRVVEHLPAPLSREESDDVVARIERHFALHGFGLWAIEVPDEHAFVGFICLQRVPFEAHFAPAVEVGWRLAAHAWGHGYAREGARAALNHAFDALDLDEVVSMTVPANVRSWRVMQALGMQRDPADDFDHPRLAGHRLERHVLYRVHRDD